MNRLCDVDDKQPGVYMVRQLRHCYPSRYGDDMSIERVFLYESIKIGKSKNLKNRLKSYEDVGYTSNDIVYCYSDTAEQSLHHERALKNIMHANPDAHCYHGHEWFRIEHAAFSNWTKPAMGLTLAMDLFEAMGQAQQFISEEVIEHCVTFGAPFPGLKITSCGLYQRIAYDSLVKGVCTDMDALQNEFDGCYTTNPRITGRYSEVMFEKMVAGLVRDGVVIETEDGLHCHWMAEDLYEPYGLDKRPRYEYTAYKPISYGTPDIRRHELTYGLHGDNYKSKIEEYIAYCAECPDTEVRPASMLY